MPIGKQARSSLTVSRLEAPVITDLGNGLRVGYLVDQGDHFEYVQQFHLAEANLTEADLHRKAVDSLRVRLASRSAVVYAWGDAFALIFDGNFEASLILVDAWWDNSLARFAPNGFVVAIPSRDVLGFCDARSATGVKALHEIIEDAKGKSHPITSTLYCRVPPSRTWRPYQGG